MGTVAFVTYGSVGDVAPVCEGARALLRAGHRVRVFGPPEHVGGGLAAGLDYRPFGDPLRTWFDRPLDVHSQVELVRFLRFLGRQLPAQHEALLRGLDGVDHVLAASLVWTVPLATRRLGLPHTFLAFCPSVLPAPSQAPPFLPPGDRPAIVNRALWASMGKGVERLLLPTGRLGGERVRGNLHEALLGQHVILACDAALAAPPEGPWEVLQTGALLPRGPFPPLPAEVEAFLDQGPPPAVLTFGSMTHERPDEATRVAVEAARAHGLRLVLQRGWARLGEGAQAEDVLVVGELAHPPLFRRARVVVHHGGSGTTATVARAGVPQVIVPHILDQHHWARRVAAQGLGAALARPRLEARTLSKALEEARRPEVQERAARLAQVLQAHDPQAAFVAAVERRLGGS